MTNIENEIKELIINSLNLEDVSIDEINVDEALFQDGLGLDSIDALELGMALQKKYNIKLESQDDSIKKHFYSVKTLAEFIQSTRET